MPFKTISILPKRKEMRKRLLTSLFVLLGLSFAFSSSIQNNPRVHRGPASQVEEIREVIEEDPVVDVSASKHEFQRKLTCDYIQYLQEALKDTPDAELSASIQESIQDLEHGLKDAKGAPQRAQRLIRQTIRDLKRLDGRIHRKALLNQTLDIACEAQSRTLGFAVRTTASVGVALTTIALLPIRFVFSFGKGLFTGREPKEPVDRFRTLFGRPGKSIASIPLYEAIRRVIFLGADPVILPFFLAPFIDRHAGIICAKPNANNPREMLFCENYEKVKGGLSKAMVGTQKAGAKVHDAIAGERDVCSWNARRQVRWARDLLAKREKTLGSTHPEILDVVLGLPAPNQCVYFKVIVKGQNQKGALAETLGTSFEGVSLVYQTEEELRLELQRLSFTDPLASARESADGFCRWFHDQKVKYAALPRGEDSMSRQLKLTLNPGRFGSVEFHPQDTSKAMLRRASLKEQSNGRNVILYYGPTAEQRQVWKTYEKTYEKEQADLASLTKQLRKIGKNESIDECVSGVKESDFDYLTYLNLSVKVPSDTVASAIESEAAFKTSYEQAGKRFFGLVSTLKLKWEFVETDTHQKMAEVLRDPTVENVVILGHGFVGGKLIDPELAIYPRTGFSWLNPRLLSISFFSCHSEEFKIYRLEEKLAETPSIHPRRFYATIKGDSFGVKGASVVGAFPSFLEELDASLYRSMKGDLIAQSTQMKDVPTLTEDVACELTIKGVVIRRGAWSVDLGNRNLGFMKEGESEMKGSFPCGWLNNEQKIYFQNQRWGDLGQSQMDVDHPQAIIRKPDQSQTVWEAFELLRREDQSVRWLQLFPKDKAK